MCREEGPQFPRETGCREAALILLKEKGLRYTPLREPLLLGRCVLCWEQEWDDCFEVTEFSTKESFIFKVRVMSNNSGGLKENFPFFVLPLQFFSFSFYIVLFSMLNFPVPTKNITFNFLIFSIEF